MRTECVDGEESGSERMRILARTAALLTILLCGWTAFAAATPNEFYLAMLRRGVSEFDAGHYEPATTSLRLAAFGLVDAVDQYEIAYVYLTIANDRLGRHDEAHEAAHRVVAADRVEHHFASLALPQTVRSAFDGIAVKLLSPADIEGLQRGTLVLPEPRMAVPTTKTPAATPPATTPANAPRVETRTVPAPEFEPPRVTKTTTTTTITPAKPEPPKPEPAKPEPVKQQPAKSEPAKTQPKVEAPKPAPVKPVPAPVQTTTQQPAPTQTSVDVPSRLAAATRALNAAQLGEARRIYRELLDVRALSRETLLRVAEGLYRSRDFAGALQAFDRLGPLRAGEEPYQYYVAVANYETGNYAAAKRALDAALPYIEVTPDVARYRTKIDGALE